MTSIKDILPDVAWAAGSTNEEYTSLCLEQLAAALIPPPSEMIHDYVAEALALARQWRKTLPKSERLSRRDLDTHNARAMLRAATNCIVDADWYLEEKRPGDAAHAIRWAEANLRTWLKEQG